MLSPKQSTTTWPSLFRSSRPIPLEPPPPPPQAAANSITPRATQRASTFLRPVSSRPSGAHVSFFNPRDARRAGERATRVLAIGRIGNQEPADLAGVLRRYVITA